MTHRWLTVEDAVGMTLQEYAIAIVLQQELLWALDDIINAVDFIHTLGNVDNGAGSSPVCR